MSKKFYAKILSLALVCTMVFAGTAVLANATDSDSKELLKNPSFETLNTEETEALNWSYTAGSLQKTGGYEDGAYLLSADSGTMGQQSIQSLKDKSMLHLSFRYKMNVVNGLSVLISVRDNNFKPITNYTDRTVKPYVVSADAWNSFEQDIYLPAGAVGVQITVSSSAASVAVDEFSLTYTEEGNLITNGSFDTGSITENEGSFTDRFGWTVARTAASGSTASVTLADDGNGGKCIAMSGLNGNGGIFQEVRNMTATTYKLSFKFKNTDYNSSYVRILWGNSSTEGMQVQTTASNNTTWQTYTIYFSWNTAQSRNLWIRSAYAGTNYIDDVVLTPISDAELRFIPVQPSVIETAGSAKNVLWFKGKEKNDLTTGNTYAVALFNPAVVTSGNVMIGVYDGTSPTAKLQSLATGMLNVTDVNYPAYAFMQISVPDTTSYIKAFVWDGISGLKPIKTPVEIRQ